MGDIISDSKTLLWFFSPSNTNHTTGLCPLYLQLSRNNGLIVILAAVLGDYGRGEIVNKGITLVPAQPSWRGSVIDANLGQHFPIPMIVAVITLLCAIYTDHPASSA